MLKKAGTEPPHRPALRYYGGKWLLAPWIISQFPKHKYYVEVFGGAASVLLRKKRAYCEVYNDAADEIVNLFRILRDRDQANELIRRLALTPFSRTEFDDAYLPATEPIEIARKLIVRSYFGYGSNSFNGLEKSGFRGKSNRQGTTPCRDWVNLPAAYQKLVERLSGVVIECENWDAILDRYDASDTLFYIDPPYIQETRGGRAHYLVEMTIDEHEALLQRLQDLSGMAVVSGYDHPLYRAYLADWNMITKNTFADGARPRTECLWLSPSVTSLPAQSVLEI